MPELPEVETVKKGLEPALVGRTITAADVRRPDLRFPFPDRFGARLTGRRIERLARRAKYILAHLDNSEVLMMHLGMSGRFTVFAPEGAKHNLGEFYYLQGAEKAGDGAHDHVVLSLDDGPRWSTRTRDGSG